MGKRMQIEFELCTHMSKIRAQGDGTWPRITSIRTVGLESLESQMIYKYSRTNSDASVEGWWEVESLFARLREGKVAIFVTQTSP